MRHAYRNRKTIGLVSTLALALVATASLGIASSPATAQTSTDLDAAKCESRAADGYLPVWNAFGDTAVAQCKSLVALRNALVGQSNLSSGHKLLQWGTGDQLKFNAWRGLSFPTGGIYNQPNGRTVSQINITDSEDGNGILSGAIPDIEDEHPTRGDGRLFDDVEVVNMGKGALTGGIPEWIYALRNLRILKLSANNLSGGVSGGSFATTAFEQIELGGNNFSETVPAFKVAENPNLVFLQLTGNKFSGFLPPSYAAFAGRNMEALALGGNRISGNLPSWIGNLRWSSSDARSQHPSIKWVFDLSGNRFCVPKTLDLGTMTESDGTTAASIKVELSGNICLGQANPVTKYTPALPGVVSMEVSGDSVQVTWRAVSGATQYLLEGKELYPESLQGELGIELSSKCQLVTAGTSAGEGLLTASLSDTNGGPDCDFDPNYMAVNVRSIYQQGSRTDGLLANVYMSAAEGRFGWNFTHVVREQPIQDIAYNLSMDTNQSISYWDGSNQRWRSFRVGQQSPNPTLETGTPITHSLVSQGWMDRIGVGSSGNDAFSGDDGDGVTLHGGWNMISAGGEASGEDADSAAFMFDDSFVDCQNLGGAIMILRYNPISRSYDVILPCHPTVQRSLIAGGAWGSIEDISEFDNLMIFFRSTLSVNIKWDADESKYVPAN